MALGGLVAWGLGGGADGVRVAVTALAIGAFISFVPAVMTISAEFWGVAVLACGVARALVTLGVAYTTVQNTPGLGSRPVMLAAAAGAGLMLLVETAASVRVLAEIERSKEALKKTGHAQAPAPMEHV